MKKTNYILFFLSLSMLSCAKLTEKPKSFISEQEFYKTEADAKQAVNAAYYMINSGGSITPGGLTAQTPYDVLFATGMEMMTDDINPGPGATNPDVRSQAVLQHNSSGLRVLQLWQFHYAGVRSANIAIDKIPQIQFSTATASVQKRYIAEAKFLRALYYFNLVRLYGDVPLILHDQNVYDANATQVPRTPTAEVYAQIEKDLISADSFLLATYPAADLGRATKGAARSILSKVYLTQGKWQKAADLAKEVIASGLYSLSSDYSRVFLPAYKNGPEHIFSAQFKANSQGQGNGNAPRGARSAVPGLTGSYADQLVYYTYNGDPYFSIYKLYQPNDKRRASGTAANSYGGAFRTKFLGSDGKTYVTLNAPGDTVPFLNKYWDPGVGSQLSESGANVPIIRYAEVLLIAAEAENEANGPGNAYQYINAVRARAGLPDLAGLSQDDFRTAVYLERRLELLWEWQRWFDLIREKGPDAHGGLLIPSLKLVGKNSVDVKHYLYPIPLQEINLNPKLTQNPGW